MRKNIKFRIISSGQGRVVDFAPLHIETIGIICVPLGSRIFEIPNGTPQDLDLIKEKLGFGTELVVE